MARFSFWGLTLGVLALTITLVSTAVSHCGPATTATTTSEPQSKPSSADGLNCTVYTLQEFGTDPAFGKWIADTIPQVVEPNSWAREAHQAGCAPGTGTISYHAAGKILVVNHTPAVQAKVDTFLKNVKKAMPTGKAAHAARTAVASGITPASYQAPAVIPQEVPPPPPQGSYPVAPPLHQPKHLFHFIIRYEGEGLIDSNVVKFTKAMYKGQAAETNAEMMQKVVEAAVEAAQKAAAPVTAPKLPETAPDSPAPTTKATAPAYVPSLPNLPPVQSGVVPVGPAQANPPAVMPSATPSEPKSAPRTRKKKQEIETTY
jgi:hypothetical protein